jgi:preprotein translocase subunit SecB
MTDENLQSVPGGGTAGGGGNGSDTRQFLLQLLFVKDLSFEAPNVPEFLQSGGNEPEVKLNLRHSSRALPDDAYEVVLHVSVHAQLQDKTVFLAELDQDGIFLIRGYDEEERKRLLAIYCPNTLFPYAREAITSVVAKGGFQPLVLQPINFEAIYAQAQANADATAQN